MKKKATPAKIKKAEADFRKLRKKPTPAAATPASPQPQAPAAVSEPSVQTPNPNSGT